jgi:hypothetical protein
MSGAAGGRACTAGVPTVGGLPVRCGNWVANRRCGEPMGLVDEGRVHIGQNDAGVTAVILGEHHRDLPQTPARLGHPPNPQQQH